MDGVNRSATGAVPVPERAIEAVDLIAAKAPQLGLHGDRLLEAYSVAQKWLDRGIPPIAFVDLVAVTARAAKNYIRTFRYFDPVVTRAWERGNEPLASSGAR